MSQSDLIEKKGEIKKNLGKEIQTVIYRFPKKDHDKMVEFSKPFTEVFRNMVFHGGVYFNLAVLQMIWNLLL